MCETDQGSHLKMSSTAQSWTAWSTRLLQQQNGCHNLQWASGQPLSPQEKGSFVPFPKELHNEATWFCGIPWIGTVLNRSEQSSLENYLQWSLHHLIWLLPPPNLLPPSSCPPLLQNSTSPPSPMPPLTSPLSRRPLSSRPSAFHWPCICLMTCFWQCAPMVSWHTEIGTEIGLGS